MEALKEDLGDALIATDIYSVHDGQGIVAYNPQPAANALFNRITGVMVKSLKESGFPDLGRYYQIELVGGKLITNMVLGDYAWGMLVDTNKAQVGLLNNVIIPKLIEFFKEAEKG
jgi:hypothetical protein